MQAEIQQLKDFLSKEENLSEPYWKSILNSDVRNIFPKYELSKIQSKKCRLAKQRLILEHLDQFLCVERASLQQSYDIQLKNIISSKGSIQLQEESKKDLQFNFCILQRKENLQKLCSALARKQISKGLLQQLRKNKKWNEYLDHHLKQKIDSTIQYGKDWMNLAKNADLKLCVTPQLQEGSSAKIVQLRIKQQMLKEDIVRTMLRGEKAKFGEYVGKDLKQIKDQFDGHSQK